MSSDLDTILDKVGRGELTPEQAREQLRHYPYRELAHGVCVDPHRGLRTGQAEVVYGGGKSEEQLREAVSGIHDTGQPVLATKLTPEQGGMLLDYFPGGSFRPEASLFSLGRELDLEPPHSSQGDLVVAAAGASDMPVALEALGTARFFGVRAGLVSDVGVAGLHRITPHLENLQQARLLVVVAGMEGALASVLGGMLDKPILAVPTSVGYGASFQGLAALLGMLNSCAPGVSVVNIDNGFGAALNAVKILRATGDRGIR
ncbi:MAG: nickel pincer cofactor biosynthesis protein LarB [Desulfohalobiaceae bacterium]|nr:nickel pincer cofactor biosynthesis protein LarB [Desulfohalobiaceae bacterium]